MADDTTTPFPSDSDDRPERQEGSGRGQRAGGQRDAGGFRIRLSDNEMQAARSLQEAFGLRSTVAVLGFALRTLAQQLQEGQLEALVAQQRAQGDQRPGRSEGRGADRRGPRQERGEDRGPRQVRIDPFARPSRPAPVPAPVIETAEGEGASALEDSPTGTADVTSEDLASDSPVQADAGTEA